MSGLGPWLAALVLAQGEPAPQSGAAPAPAAAERAAEVVAPGGEEAGRPAPGAAEVPAESNVPAEPKVPAAAPAANPPIRPERTDAAPAAERSRRGPTPPSTATPTPTPTAAPKPSPARTPASAPAVVAPPPAPLPQPAVPPAGTAAIPRGPPPTDQDQVALAARQFLEALAGGDADALASASSEQFSFDGEMRSGRDDIRQRWRTLLAGRHGPAPAIGHVEVLPSEVAVARHGKPPARLAPLARPNGYVAIGDVGGRTVVLFLAREGGRISVLGMHD